MLSHSLALAAALTAVSADNNFEIIGDGLVSAQMMYVASENIVYIVDKTENNPATINGHPAWASEYDLSTNTARAMDVLTNSFCAGGTTLGDGRLINVGGNQPVGPGGQAVANGGSFQDADGGAAFRVLTPCTDHTCNWDDTAYYMTGRRWYPTLETLANGSSIIIGGDMWGGFVNQASQNNPTYEFYPQSDPKQSYPMAFLNNTMPANLYPITYLVPSGKLFMQANWQAMMFDYTTGEETYLPNITHAVRVYPASGGNTMLPLTPANNWTAEVIFCGGSDVQTEDWAAHSQGGSFDQLAADANYWRTKKPSKSCVSIKPDEDATWVDNDDLPEERSMGQLINLPDGRLFLLNGVSNGVAGYDNNSLPYGTDPIYAPAYFDSSANSGNRWSRPDNLQNASLPRLYHSVASLLADGSVLVAGSNPYRDFQVNGSDIITDSGAPAIKAEFWSETRLEKFYPDYYSKTRPQPTNLPTSISYGGDIMQVGLNTDDIKSVSAASDVKAVLIRTGFSTHAMNFGQRHVELETSLVANGTGATLNIAPLKPNPAILAPGPVFMFVVVNGVPSMGKQVMVGSGQIEEQPLGDYPTLPASSQFTASVPITTTTAAASTKTSASSSSDNKSNTGNGSGRMECSIALAIIVAALASLM